MQGNYTSFPGFEDISLEDSYVLDIVVHPAVLILKLDVLLLPGHPEHRLPAPGERACFRQATVVFSSVRDLHWTGQSVIRPAIDASGSADYGSVDSLTRVDNSYRILGDWGEISLQADAPSLSIHPPHTLDPNETA
ncbi:MULTISPECIES: hypothetical protein [unclassified Streptomyces]|uniref:hypothetical protein n=1 Tax=unclassified Streptomyces TaxID=2593676 RepID=UPI000690E995|nr:MULTISPECIES: hypothetical protein [unclassified Streptomyces]KOV73382.1 hypothetical protein ADL02_40115 [Streptomyces sp. NRRL WC-3723]